MTEPEPNPVDEDPIRIEISLDSPKVLADVAAAHQITLDELVVLCRDLIDRHWRSLGIRAITLEYTSSQGYLLRASSAVGSLKGGRLEILVAPKVPGLGLEKALAMAQYAGNPGLKIGNERIRAELDPSVEYGLIDLLGFSLCDAVFAIVANGLLTATREVLQPSKGANCGPDIDANLSRGFVPPLLVSTAQSEKDLPSNQLIKAALQKVRDTTGQSRLRELMVRNISQFEGVGELPDDPATLDRPQDFFGVPRPDYDRAISLASAILNTGSVSLDGLGQLGIPDVIVDMDLTFERFCSKVLYESFNAEVEVHLQPSLPHLTEPLLPSRSIVPDIVVTEVSTGRKIVVDVKNRYSGLDPSAQPSISNSDLFQQYYYAKNMSAYCGILLYPSTDPSWEFPLRGTESSSTYRSKGDNALKSPELRSFRIKHDGAELDLYALQVDLSGPLRKSVRSVNRIAFFINRLLQDAE